MIKNKFTNWLKSKQLPKENVDYKSLYEQAKQELEAQKQALNNLDSFVEEWVQENVIAQSTPINEVVEDNPIEETNKIIKKILGGGK